MFVIYLQKFKKKSPKAQISTLSHTRTIQLLTVRRNAENFLVVKKGSASRTTPSETEGLPALMTTI
jgi:hypothetical protein